MDGGNGQVGTLDENVPVLGSGTTTCPRSGDRFMLLLLVLLLPLLLLKEGGGDLVVVTLLRFPFLFLFWFRGRKKERERVGILGFYLGDLVMAEILCGVLSGSESSGDACEQRSQVARRRRMEPGRFRIVSGMATTAVVERERKKRRIDCKVSSVVQISSGSEVEHGAINLSLDLNSTIATGTADDFDSSKKKMEERVKLTLKEEEEVVEVVSCHWYGMTSVCGRRREMEDTVSIRPGFLKTRAPEFHFYGVFDGHGCSHVAVACKERMHEVLAEEINGATTSIPTPSEWKNVMERSFSRVDTETKFSNGQDVICKCAPQMLNHVGSTAVVAVVSPDKIVVSNCGDSRAVLCRGGLAIPLSSDHKPDRPDELQRIQEAGGRVIYWDGARVLGVLAMSRAIGDYHLKPYVTPEPEVTVTDRVDEDECLILASDGLWDVVSNSTACEVARMCLRGRIPGSKGSKQPVEGDVDKQGGSDKACVEATILLTKLALARRSADNVSVVVVDLRRWKNDQIQESLVRTESGD